MRNKSILYISTNKNKIAEIQYIVNKIFTHYKLKIKSPNYFQRKKIASVEQLIENVEDGASYEENAYKKAKFYSELLNKNLLVEDSGLEIDCLKSELGVHTKEWNAHLNQYKKNALLIERVNEINKKNSRANHNCRYISCFCYYDLDKQIHEIFTGILDGKIATSEKLASNPGFAFDPIFLINYYDQIIPISELSFTEKNELSHRSIAIKKFCEWYNNKDNN